MRTYWLGLIALLWTAGCAHEGKLIPKAGAVPLTEDGKAAVAGAEGVRLVAYGSGWKGKPANLDRQFTVLKVRLENDSGRPLSVSYQHFELAATEVYVARDPSILGELLAARAIRVRPPAQSFGTELRSQRSLLPNRLPRTVDTTYSPYNGTSPYRSPPCHGCVLPSDYVNLPTPDMLRSALPLGPLEPGESREGYLFFEKPLSGDEPATLKVKLVDASTGEPFGALSIPFEVR